MTGCSLRYLVVLIVAVGALSWLIRALPFLLFGRSGEPPKLVVYIGRVLSPAAIAMLVVYCYAGYVRDRPPAEHLGMLAEFAAGAVTVANNAATLSINIDGGNAAGTGLPA